MQEIGQELKQAREDRGLTLEALSSSTLIAKKYLKALEEGDFDQFPGEVYLKGALRKYATEVGLDPEPLLTRYTGTEAQTDNQDNEQPKPVEKKKPMPEAVMKNYNTVRRINKGRLAMFVLVLALLFVGVRAILISADSPASTEPPALEDNELPGEQTPDDQPAPDGEPAEEEEPEDVEEQEPEMRIEAEDIQGGERFTVYNADSLVVDLSFSARCWVRAHTDGSQEFEHTFSAGDERSVRAENELRFRFGAASAVTVEVNGETIELPQSGNAYNVEIVLAEED
ncbi:helix-turn-helix domain-containing protein [Dethiobacter alkaliphilus]|uniref:Cytoskeleton protein RodZ-like C-terminal domain-containing protein n=1 Tax=Dethiobacter alkaliphilus AHT 1 TaxID=555088 RepID=C0GKG3_DETAL|nr:helix-turn-helix domain-containing protein [Dethiobacter alkaliphilus]EEG76206.1 conserved hypothetical protein [Dethiobacter alkaliphilus AHT 1]